MESLSLEFFKSGAGVGPTQRQVGAESSRIPFCCDVMRGRPLHCHVIKVEACLAFSSNFSAVC